MWTQWNCCACCHGNVQEGSWEVHSSLQPCTATYWQRKAFAHCADDNKSVFMLKEHCKGFLNWIAFGSQDTGISVRKRVIKILRDICLEQPTFSKITEMCVKMIRRVNDEEGIKVWIILYLWLLIPQVVLRYDILCFRIVILIIYHASFYVKRYVLSPKTRFLQRVHPNYNMTHKLVLCRNWWMRHSRSYGLLQLQPMTKRPWPGRSWTSLMWYVNWLYS